MKEEFCVEKRGRGILRKILNRRPDFSILGIMAGSFLLNFLRIGREGFGDKYYAAAVKSMLSSWHNFFFASFDPGGFVTVDKPAAGLWLQTVSAAVFGFKGWAIILPQALAGALSVGLLYVLVKKAYGRTAGLVAGFILAVTPITVAASRTNQLDILLVFVLLAAAWATMNAAVRSSLGWLLAAMAFVGLGFNVKMLAAFTVLPAIVVLYFFGVRLKFWKKIRHLALAGVVLLAVSLSWALVVDTTPEDARPYVDSSKNNSVIELAVDWNGINRLIPQWLRRGRPGFPRGGGLGLRPINPANAKPQTNSPTPPAKPGAAAQGASSGNGSRINAPPLKPLIMRGGLGGGGFANETGQAGVFRLFGRQLGGQIGWLIVFGLCGVGVAVSKMKRPLFKDSKSRAVLFWSVWFFSMAVYFSTSGFYHRYYLVLIAPSIAALCGISVVELRDSWRQRGFRGWVLPAAILATAAVQITILHPYQGWSKILFPVITVLSLASAGLLIIFKVKGVTKPALEKTAVAIGLAGLILAPFAWAGTPMIHGGVPAMPFAGPELSNRNANGAGVNAPAPMMRPGAMNEGFRPEKLIDFLRKNRRNEKYLVAVPTAREAWDIILETGAPVMAMGGFLGSDKILTPDKVDRMVKNGEIRYFLVRVFPAAGAGLRPIQLAAWSLRGLGIVFNVIPGPGPGQGPAMGMGMGMRGGGEEQLEVERWIEKNGKPVPDEAWRGDAGSVRVKPPAMGQFRPGNPGQRLLQAAMRNALKLYDLRPEPKEGPAK
jgi:4-amino-4-deoxy-L-arabinose transferase-like glycosyltransferase